MRALIVGAGAMGEARVAVERLHHVAFARAPVEEPALT